PTPSLHVSMLSKDGYTTIDFPDSTYTTLPTGINASGQIVGTLVAAGGTHGFQLVDETHTTLDVPGSANTAIDGINDAGQIVGGYDGHGFLRDIDGTYTTLDVPGAEATRARGINNAGQIVGEYFDGIWHGFVLSDERYTALDVPGAIQTFAYGINDSGQIVGQYRMADDNVHGFIAIPKPSP